MRLANALLICFDRQSDGMFVLRDSDGMLMEEQNFCGSLTVFDNGVLEQKNEHEFVCIDRSRIQITIRTSTRFVVVFSCVVRYANCPNNAGSAMQ